RVAGFACTGARGSRAASCARKLIPCPHQAIDTGVEAMPLPKLPTRMGDRVKIEENGEADVVTAAPPAPKVEAPGEADTASRPTRAAAAKKTAARKSVAKKATATKTAAKKAAAKSPAVHAPAAPAVPAAREKTTAT